MYSFPLFLFFASCSCCCFLSFRTPTTLEMASLFTAEAERTTAHPHTHTAIQTAQPNINGTKWRRDTHNKIVRATKKTKNILPNRQRTVLKLVSISWKCLNRRHFILNSSRGVEHGFFDAFACRLGLFWCVAEPDQRHTEHWTAECDRCHLKRKWITIQIMHTISQTLTKWNQCTLYIIRIFWILNVARSNTIELNIIWLIVGFHHRVFVQIKWKIWYCPYEWQSVENATTTTTATHTTGIQKRFPFQLHATCHNAYKSWCFQFIHQKRNNQQRMDRKYCNGDKREAFTLFRLTRVRCE